MKDILKKYTGKIILVVLLLLVQAYCDLALPDYTSKIINVGIQQKGISSEVADVLTDKTFDNLSALNNKLKGYYEKVDKTDKNIKKYPYLKDGAVYKLIDSVSEDGKSEIVDATVIYSFLISNEQIKNSGIDINPTTIEYYTKK